MFDFLCQVDNFKKLLITKKKMRNKKKTIKWLDDNWDELHKYTKITPSHSDLDNKAFLVIEIGTNTNRLVIELDKSRVGIIDTALHCLTIAQNMSDEPIRTNGKAN